MQGGNEEDVEEEQGDRRKNTVQCKQFHHATSPDKLRIDLSECGCNTVGHQKDDIVFRIRQQLQQRREHDKAQNAAGLNDISRCENTPLVKSVVRRYSGKNVEYDDLMQLGSMGLLKAIKNFDENFNVRFSTYAVPMIAGEIKRFIRDDGAVKVSRALKLLAYNIGKFKDDFSKTNNREPTIDEISKEFNVDKEEVVFALDSTRYPLSLNDTQSDDEGAPLIDKIGENTSNDLDDKIILKGVIKNLPDREKKIIILRYYRDKTQSEVAGIMGVSQVQISRIENKILSKIKESFNNK